MNLNGQKLINSLTRMSLDFESNYGDRLPTVNIEEEIRVPEYVRRLLANTPKNTLPRGLFLAGPETVKLRHKTNKLLNRPRTNAYRKNVMLKSQWRNSIANLSNIAEFQPVSLPLSPVTTYNQSPFRDNGLTTQSESYTWESKRIHVKDIPFTPIDDGERPVLVTFRNTILQAQEKALDDMRNSDYEIVLKRLDSTSLHSADDQDLQNRARNLLHSDSFAIKRPQLFGQGALNRRAAFSQSVLNLRDIPTSSQFSQSFEESTNNDLFNKFSLPRISWAEYDNNPKSPKVREWKPADESTT